MDLFILKLLYLNLFKEASINGVLVFYILVKWSDVIGATGLDTSLTFAVFFWIFGISATSLWHHHFGQGPIERLYRLIGG